MSKKNMGGNFDDFLSENAMLDEATAVAIKRVVAWQIELEMNNEVSANGATQSYEFIPPITQAMRQPPGFFRSALLGIARHPNVYRRYRLAGPYRPD